MVSLSRRQAIQVLIAGIGAAAAPAFAALPEKSGKLVLSGRILRADGKALAGATFAVGEDRVTTDADGRFVVMTDTRAAGGFASNARRDADGTWRATLGLTLA